MPKPEPAVPDDVARAVSLYSDTETTVPEITARTGIKGNDIYRALPKFGLLSRRQTRERQQLAGAQTPDIVPHKSTRTPASKTLVRRLRRLAHVQLIQLETEMVGASHPSGSSAERHVRVLRNLLKTLQEVTSLENQLNPKQNLKDKAINDDRQRAELAKRIAALKSRA